MTILKIVECPADILDSPANDVPVNEIKSSAIQTLIQDMIDTCHDAGGYGLAANQVGSDKSILVYRMPGTNDYSTLINPVIMARNGKVTSRGEGCLSIPDAYFDVKRYKQIKVEALNADGEFGGMRTKSKKVAKILQHEIDHLDGVLFTDKGKAVRGVYRS